MLSVFIIEGSISMSIPVLYSDGFLLVCQKPVGVLSESPGIPELIREQTGIAVWPVHRLDYGTGGIMILARSPQVCSAVQDLFNRNLVRKEYLAVVAGRPDGTFGRYEDLLFHDRHKNKTFVVDRMRSGVKKAVCEWELLESVSCSGEILSLMRIVLHTGRTHQVRVQFGSRAHPLAGDGKYGSRIKAGAPALWAYRVTFPHPCVKNAEVCAASVPESVYPWSLFTLSGL